MLLLAGPTDIRSGLSTDRITVYLAAEHVIVSVRYCTVTLALRTSYRARQSGMSCSPGAAVHHCVGRAPLLRSQHPSNSILRFNNEIRCSRATPFLDDSVTRCSVVPAPLRINHRRAMRLPRIHMSGEFTTECWKAAVFAQARAHAKRFLTLFCCWCEQ